MRRRDFIALAVAATALPRAALAQAAKVPRLAVVWIPSPPQYLQALLEGLASAGYVEGRTIAIDQFVAPGIPELAAFAAQAVSTKPDIIFAYGTPAALAAKNATSSIPIVFFVADPVGVGLIPSLAQPGGNLTGVTNLASG